MRKFIVIGIGVLGMLCVPGFSQTAPLVGDASFATGNATNFGSTPTLNVGGALGFQGLLQFDFSKLPAGTTASQVSSATLRLYVNKIGTAGTVDIFAANGAWNE